MIVLLPLLHGTKVDDIVWMLQSMMPFASLWQNWAFQFEATLLDATIDAEQIEIKCIKRSLMKCVLPWTGACTLWQMPVFNDKTIEMASDGTAISTVFWFGYESQQAKLLINGLPEDKGWSCQKNSGGKDNWWSLFQACMWWLTDCEKDPCWVRYESLRHPEHSLHYHIEEEIGDNQLKRQGTNRGVLPKFCAALHLETCGGHAQIYFA